MRRKGDGLHRAKVEVVMTEFEIYKSLEIILDWKSFQCPLWKQVQISFGAEHRGSNFELRFHFALTIKWDESFLQGEKVSSLSKGPRDLLLVASNVGTSLIIRCM